MQTRGKHGKKKRAREEMHRVGKVKLILKWIRESLIKKHESHSNQRLNQRILLFTKTNLLIHK